MGWAHGHNNNGREVGYGVAATCDHEGCGVPIDRGVAYLCGPAPDGFENAGMDDEAYCGDYFCYEHLTYIPTLQSGEYEGVAMQVCVGCASRQPCPACGNRGSDDDGEPCVVCDSHGLHAQRDGALV